MAKHIPRIYCPELKTGVFRVPGDHISHMLRVLRMKQGDRFLAFCADAGEWECTITEIKSGCVDAQQLRKVREYAGQKKLALAICQIKPENMRLIIEKCTELGATHFYLLSSEYTNYHSDISKLRRIAISASEQSERIDISEIHEEKPLGEFATNLPGEYVWFAAIERESDACPLLEITTHREPIGFIVGAEGGFSDAEKMLLRKHIKPVCLSANILRTETAAITCVAIGGMKYF